MERIAWIHMRLGQLRTERTNLEVTRNRLNAELERLRQAKDGIAAQLSDHADFRREVRQVLSTFMGGRFRGDNRNRKNNRLSSMHDHLVTQQNRHEDNSNSLRTQISTREEERDTTVRRLTNVNNEITNLERELSSIRM